ncbi:MAG: hypothetical protein M5R40_08585 [Anaerolineae bacterium]|nr:hypothetical protein [Anaerolineae bacterium]
MDELCLPSNRAAAEIAKVREWQSSDTLMLRGGDIENLLDGMLGSGAGQEWVNNTSNLPPEITLRETRDFLWADTDEQKEAILKEVYERLGQPLPSGGVLPPKVRMMTMHGAKGLDAAIVFVPGLEEEILPGPKRQPYPGLVLEAARLLYVSISRARVACIISCARNRVVYGKFVDHTRSRYTDHLGGRFISRQSDGLSPQEIASIVHEYRLLR